jgi:flagellar protein FliO/FliZ
MQGSKITIKNLLVIIVVNSWFCADLFAAEDTAEKLPQPITPSGFSDPNMAGNLLQTTLGLLVVLVVIGAAAWAFKRFGNVNMGAQGRMKIIGGVSLGTRERAVLLQVGDQQLVVGVAPGRVQTLHVLDKPLSMEDKQVTTNSFSSRLQSAILNRNQTGNEGGQK